ncbi:MAG: ABC transporter permease [Bacteroidota bacterium]|nr:ABC transporter permease [Bacteroidota bacterium]
MITHYIKLIWNRKRANMLMIIEVFFSFLVIFAIASISIFTYRNYVNPIGFEYETSEATEGSESSQEDTKKNIVLHYKKLIFNYLKKYPEIEIYAASGPNVPYVFNGYSSTVENNEGQKINSQIFHNDDHYADAMQLNLVEGRWFSRTDDASRLKPVVINKHLKDHFFEDDQAVGKVVKLEDHEFQVVGVVEEYRQHGEFVKSEGAVFQRLNIDNEDFWYNNILIKVKPGTGAAFEEQLIKDLGTLVPGWTFIISSLERLRDLRKRTAWIPLVIIYCVCGFLIINVALGLFGVLWYSINRRYSEIGLRRAVGSTSAGIQYQFLIEILILSTFGILLGCVFAFQFPLLNVFNISSGIYILAILVSIFILYVLAAICAWYPGYQASKIEPAVALHDE